MTSDVATAEPPAHAASGAAAPSRSRPSVRERLAAPMPGGVWAWLGPVGVAIVGGVLRFWNLGFPHKFVLDETYYAKDAWTLLRSGYERDWPEDIDQAVLDGSTNIYEEGASFVVHPPFGKWAIAAGEALFGFDPFGWRFAVAALGTLSILMVARIAMRLTRSVLLGCLAGLLLAVDGLHFVMSRTSMLDGILMFWVLAAFGCLLIDRDDVRRRLANAVSSGRRWHPDFGPMFKLRPWRIAAGVCLGLACSTKWSGLFFVAAFGLMTVLWDAGARKSVGVRRPYVGALWLDSPAAVLSIVGLGLAVYLGTWTGWFLSDDAWGRTWAGEHPSSWWFVPDSLRSLWHYHWQMWDFHKDLADSHPYQSNAWGWLVLARPILFEYTTLQQGDDGCAATECSSAILAIGTPTLWWLAIVALAYMVWRWAGPRDWRAGAVLAGMVGGYAPWLILGERTKFYFYAVVFTPFLVLAVTLMLGALLGGPGAQPSRRAFGATIAGGLVLLIVINFVYFYPILSGEPIPTDQWRERMWFTSWV